MDRNNGGDPKVPPRPPKSIIARVHRPRAPDPFIINENMPQLSPKPKHFQGNIIHNNNNNNISNINETERSQLAIARLSPIVNSSYNNNNLSSIRSPRPLSVSPNLSTTFTRRRSPLSVTSIQTVSQTVQNSESIPTAVTLSQPRPENERLTNEYVDTPFTGTQHSSVFPRGVLDSVIHTTVGSQQSNRILFSHVSEDQESFRPSIIPLKETGSCNQMRKLCPVDSNDVSSNNCVTVPSENLSSSAIIKQPLSFTKDGVSNTLSDGTLIDHQDDLPSSITCPTCKKCRCEECQRPRQLPSKWICGNTCLCSSETIIDYTSCLCCVKALYYHCSKDHEIEQEDETIVCADNPCSCAPYNLLTRWACLGTLSLVLPCLFCYWPLKGCVNICAKCYAKYSRHGCQCSAETDKNLRIFQNLRQEKRLLDSNSDY
ncbi:protein sprouty [Culicoides brevitarsis]|uniref:protein sprouty n=1 Tax=Culicoides brevitarsis TaxID=469753 RepID=UPI00307BDB6D